MDSFGKTYSSGFYKNTISNNNKRSMTPIKSNNNFNFNIVEKLTNLPDIEDNYTNVEWISLSDFDNKFDIFPKKFLPENFDQGTTGLCFLFSCLASIAGVPRLIDQLFGNNDNWKKTKKFIVYLFYNKERKKIVISDNFPFIPYNNNYN